MNGPLEETTMNEQSEVIATVGDPDQSLIAASMIVALNKLRLSGASGPVEFRLRPRQAADIEAALVAVTNEPGRIGMAFRNVPVVCSCDYPGEAVDTASGRRVAIMSSDDSRSGERVPDPRAAVLGPAELATLQAEHKEVRRQHMSETDRLCEGMVEIRDYLQIHMRWAPADVLQQSPLGVPVQGGPYRAIRTAIEAIDALLTRR